MCPLPLEEFLHPHGKNRIENQIVHATFRMRFPTYCYVFATNSTFLHVVLICCLLVPRTFAEFKVAADCNQMQMAGSANAFFTAKSVFEMLRFFAKFGRALPRLYRNRHLRVSIHCAAFKKIRAFLHRSHLKILE